MLGGATDEGSSFTAVSVAEGCFSSRPLSPPGRGVRQVQAAEVEAAVLKPGVHFIAWNIVCVIYLMCLVHKKRLLCIYFKKNPSASPIC